MEDPIADVKASAKGGSSQTERWIKEQDVLKERLVVFDDFPWRLGAVSTEEGKALGGGVDGCKLRYVGGVDLSFAKEDSSFACGALVIMDLESMQVVYEDFDVVHLTMPYVAGLLAFRETLVLLGLLKKMAAKAPLLYPQLLMVDGNGILHPRGFGLASHLGVLADIPTIGIGKNGNILTAVDLSLTSQHPFVAMMMQWLEALEHKQTCPVLEDIHDPSVLVCSAQEEVQGNDRQPMHTELEDAAHAEDAEENGQTRNSGRHTREAKQR